MSESGFKRTEVEILLAQCHRRCCICHRFCGARMHTHHIVKGAHAISNALPVCFDCHAEIHAFNDNQPLGRKYTVGELERHKEQWLRLCNESSAGSWMPPAVDAAGPLQALVDELEFNRKVVDGIAPSYRVGCQFSTEHFHRAVAEGAISILQDDLKTSLYSAYVAMGDGNYALEMNLHVNKSEYKKDAQNAKTLARDLIDDALRRITQFVGTDEEEQTVPSASERH